VYKMHFSVLVVSRSPQCSSCLGYIDATIASIWVLCHRHFILLYFINNIIITIQDLDSTLESSHRIQMLKVE